MYLILTCLTASEPIKERKKTLKGKNAFKKCNILKRSTLQLKLCEKKCNIIFFKHRSEQEQGKKGKVKKFTNYFLLRGVSRDAEYYDVINKAHNSVSHMSSLLCFRAWLATIFNFSRQNIRAMRQRQYVGFCDALKYEQCFRLGVKIVFQEYI